MGMKREEQKVKEMVVCFLCLVEPRDVITIMQGSRVYHIDLGCRGFHPTNGEKAPGEMFYACICLCGSGTYPTFDSGTYPTCDSNVEFVHTDLCINSMACVVSWLSQQFHKLVHSVELEANYWSYGSPAIAHK